MKYKIKVNIYNSLFFLFAKRKPIKTEIDKAKNTFAPNFKSKSLSFPVIPIFATAIKNDIIIITLIEQGNTHYNF